MNNSVGIDISKGKSTVAIMRPCGEVVAPPFEICHTNEALRELAQHIRDLDGETKVVMEATGNYHKPVALALQEYGFYVSVVNPVLVHNHGKLCYIKHIKAKLNILADGDLGYPVTVRRNDEPSDLADGIDQMRKSIAAHQAAGEKTRPANAKLVHLPRSAHAAGLSAGLSGSVGARQVRNDPRDASRHPLAISPGSKKLLTSQV